VYVVELNELRELFDTEHANNPAYHKLTRKGPFRPATAALVSSNGQAVQEKRLKEEMAFFSSTSRLMELGLVYDITEQTMNDPAHNIGNNVKDTLCCILNIKNMKFTLKHLAHEHSQGRFEDVHGSITTLTTHIAHTTHTITTTTTTTTNTTTIIITTTITITIITITNNNNNNNNNRPHPRPPWSVGDKDAIAVIDTQLSSLKVCVCVCERESERDRERERE
jgi:hypothetical protein